MFRPSVILYPPVSSVSPLRQQFAVLALLKNEALGLREWLEHYIWQGVDAFVLLDNGSSDTYAHILRDFPTVTLLPAPEPHAQTLHYGEIGRPLLESWGVEFVAVVDLDEFMWSGRKGYSLKNLIVETFDKGGKGAIQASQISCPFYHFGSNGYVTQPPSIRQCLTRRSAVTSEVVHGKSIVRLSHLLRFNLHSHEVSSVTLTCPSDLFLFHYKCQSREYWKRVKMPRGDATTQDFDGARTWVQFDLDDRTGNATFDTRLRDDLWADRSFNRSEC